MASVECYSGGHYAEDPRVLVWEGRRLAVAEILVRWRTPTGRRFKVRTEDGRVFDLEYNEFQDSWTISEP